jgi:NADPH:quinone reductase-like Zn-dependent oxidoreductase
MTTPATERRTEASPVSAGSGSGPGAGVMNAIVQDAYGAAPEDVLRLAEAARPAIRDNEVLVRVSAARVDRGTWHLMAGLPSLMRVAGVGLRKPKALNPGRSIAGTVELVGPDVTGFAPGDEVSGTGAGAFAEYVAARAGKLAAKPANLSFEQAATLPVSAVTALQAVRNHGRVQPGQTVLIIGASGGVGSFAVQIAKAFGAEVTPHREAIMATLDWYRSDQS